LINRLKAKDKKYFTTEARRDGVKRKKTKTLIASIS